MCFTLSFTVCFTHACTVCFIHSCTVCFTLSCTVCFTLSCTVCFTHSFTVWFHTFIHCVFHTCIHCVFHTFIHCVFHTHAHSRQTITGARHRIIHPIRAELFLRRLQRLRTNHISLLAPQKRPSHRRTSARRHCHVHVQGGSVLQRLFPRGRAGKQQSVRVENGEPIRCGGLSR
jgi:hypothetical protein